MKTTVIALLLVCLGGPWGLVAWAQDTVQTVVGLPEYGVTLTGTVQNPTIVNNSGKTIIGHVLGLGYASGGAQYRRNLTTHGLRLNMKNLAAGIPPGGTESPLSHSPTVVKAWGPTTLTPLTFARVVLDAVVFADGQFVGPDQGHNFEGMANQVIAEHELAGLVSAARNDATKREAAWAEVMRLACHGCVDPGGADLPEQDLSKRPPPQNRPPEFLEWAQEVVARDLIFARNRAGDDAAYDIADREMSIPKLWRARQ
jgi:hypothetical protein